jgi:hypothetical protein
MPFPAGLGGTNSTKLATTKSGHPLTDQFPQCWSGWKRGCHVNQRSWKLLHLVLFAPSELLTKGELFCDLCLCFHKMDAGTASDSVAPRYERDELPHTLPCVRNGGRRETRTRLSLHVVQVPYPED